MKIVIIFLAFAAGALSTFFYSSVDLETISRGLPAIISIFIAAILIRLARGIPQFKYEDLSTEKLSRIVEAFRFLERAYVSSLAVLFLTLSTSLIYAAVYEDLIYDWVKAMMTGSFSTLIILSIGEALAIISLDIHIFEVQRRAMREWIQTRSERDAAAAAKSVKDAAEVAAQSERK